jgi:hypothetical protein
MGQTVTTYYDHIETPQFGPVDALVSDGIKWGDSTRASGGGRPLFQDGFETGDLTHTDRGVYWVGGNATRIRTIVEDPAAHIYNGIYSLRFRYAGVPDDEDGISELDFDLGAEYPEIWVEYYIHIPVNYIHRTQAGSDNNKWFYLADTKVEADYYVKALLETFPGNGVDGSLDQARPMWGTNLLKGGHASSSYGMANPQKLITDDDLGNWLRFRFYFKVGDAGRSNGIFQFWKDDALFISEYGLDNDPVDGQVHGYRKGYVMGHSNSGFLDDTHFFLDQFTVYDEDPEWETDLPLYHDNFESEDLTYVEGGFDWKPEDETYLVKGDGADDNYIVYPVPSGPIAGKQWENGPVGGVFDEIAMRFNYPANEPLARQDWSIPGAAQLSEFWCGFWWRVPINFSHPDAGEGSQKLCSFWVDDYEVLGNGPTITTEFKRIGSGRSYLSFHLYKTLGSPGDRLSEDYYCGPLITELTDRGRWMHLLWHVKAATDLTSGDGIVELYWRWEEWNKYLLGYGLQNAHISLPAGELGFQNGYLMGWANSPYPVQTEFLADDFKIWAADPGLVPIGAAPIIDDDFEGGPKPWWTNWNRTRIGTVADGHVVYAGENSLRFRYPDIVEVPPPASEVIAEQKFKLVNDPANQPGYDEIWIEYMLYCPTNFSHDTPYGAPGNNKFFEISSIYNDVSSALRPHITMEYWPQGGGASRWERYKAYTFGEKGSVIGTEGKPNFMGVGMAIEPGNWYNIKFHFRSASARDVADGIMETFIDDVRWHFLEWDWWGAAPGDSVPGDPGQPMRMNYGYVMGSARSGWIEETKFYVDDFKIYTTDPGWQQDIGSVYANLEDGDHSHFLWTDNGTRVSIVYSTDNLGVDNYVSWPTPSGPDGLEGRDWENSPFTPGDSYAMRFRYPAGQELAEQRWNFPESFALSEIWLRWDLKVPINFLHEDVPGSDNNKLWRMWMDAGEADGSKVGMSFRPDLLVSGGSDFFCKISPGRGAPVGGDLGSTSFISVPGDRGRWMQILVRVKAETAEDASDGIMQVWRRWEDEGSFTLTHDLSGQPIRIPIASPYGFCRGYLMGAANAEYSSDTEWLLDNFTIWSSDPGLV